MSITFKKIRTIRRNPFASVKNTAQYGYDATRQMRSNIIDEKQVKQSSTTVHTINTLLVLTIGIVGVLYLVQVNSLSTKGYTIKELEKNIFETKKEQEALQMHIVEAQSLGRLGQKIDTLGLVKSERVDYITPAKAIAVR